MPTQAGTKPLYVIGQGSVRVEIIETPYGFCEVQPVRHGYSKITGEVGTSSRFDIFQIDELVHCLKQAQTFLRQKSGNKSQFPASSREGESHG